MVCLNLFRMSVPEYPGEVEGTWRCRSDSEGLLCLLLQWGSTVYLLIFLIWKNDIPITYFQIIQFTLYVK